MVGACARVRAIVFMCLRICLRDSGCKGAPFFRDCIFKDEIYACLCALRLLFVVLYQYLKPCARDCVYVSEDMSTR